MHDDLVNYIMQLSSSVFNYYLECNYRMRTCCPSFVSHNFLVAALMTISFNIIFEDSCCDVC